MILGRDIGLEISRATLDGWVLRVGELLIPMVAAMRQELISGSYIQADETPVDVQTCEGRGQNRQAYLWQYSRPGASVVFDVRLGRGRDGPRRFLGQFEGILQTDGYAAYNQIGGPGMVHAACWAHARRQFFEAVQLNPRDLLATPIVAQGWLLGGPDLGTRGVLALATAQRNIAAALVVGGKDFDDPKVLANFVLMPLGALAIARILKLDQPLGIALRENKARKWGIESCRKSEFYRSPSQNRPLTGGHGSADGPGLSCNCLCVGD